MAQIWPLDAAIDGPDLALRVLTLTTLLVMYDILQLIKGFKLQIG